MSIQSKDEFDVVLSDVLLGLERISYERPNDAGLIQARRDLKMALEAVKQGTTTKLIVDKFAKASEVARSRAGDPDVDDRLLDLADYMSSLV